MISVGPPAGTIIIPPKERKEGHTEKNIEAPKEYILKKEAPRYTQENYRQI
jgi:hypothetical protein